MLIQVPGANIFDLRVCHVNIRSIRSTSKLLSIKSELAEDYDVIALSETWLCNNVKSENLRIPGFQMPFRRDRDEGHSPYGGIMAYVSNNVACKRRNDLENNDLEIMWLELRSDNKKLFMCIAYRSEANTDFTFWEKLQINIDNIRTRYNPKILICGDLNADFNTRHGQYLLDFVNGNDFNYHIKKPTRITSTSATILDQFVSNFPIFTKDVSIMPPLPGCDHCVIAAKLTFKFCKPKAYTRLMWNFKIANYALYRERLAQYDWDKCFESGDIDTINDNIVHNIFDAAKHTIPNKVVTVRPHNKPWYTNELRQLKRRMHRTFYKANKSQNPNTWLSFRQLRQEYNDKILNAKKCYDLEKYASLASGSKNTKKWWTLIKNVYKTNDFLDSIPPIETDNDILTLDLDKAEAFNMYFLAASQLDDSEAEIPENPINVIFNAGLRHINIKKQDVIDQLKILDCSKSFGPDGISPIFLKEGGDIIVNVLHRFYSLSMQLGKVPKSFKKANVIPIHKKRF